MIPESSDNQNVQTAGNSPEQPSSAKAVRMLQNTELSAFCGQMALIMKAGIPAEEGIFLMKDDAADSAEKELLTRILEHMEYHGSFADALRESGAFPPYFIHMTEIGERTGNLDTVMRALGEHYEREEVIRRSTRNAVFYPLILSAMMLAVIIVLLVRVMPVFNDVFRGLGTEMTGLPAFLMQIGGTIRTYAVVFLIIVFAAVLLVFLLSRTEKGNAALRRFTHLFPQIRRSDRLVASCRFAGAMSMTLASGLTPEESIELAEELNENPEFGKQIAACKKDMIEGKSFSHSLYDNRIFTGIYSKMISIGQKTGSMDQVMGEIADSCQEEIDTDLSNRLATLEPLLVIVMSVAIGAILLSVMFPLLGIMSSI